MMLGCSLNHMTTKRSGTTGKSTHVLFVVAVRTMQRVLFVVLVISATEAHYYYPHHTEITTRSYFQATTPPTHDMTVLDERTGIRYNPLSKHHPGRHVCPSGTNTHPVKTNQVHCKPVYKRYMVKCGQQWCAGVRLVYEKVQREVNTDANTGQAAYSCCPGWAQVSNKSHGCNKPVCSPACRNGGKCVKPNICSCGGGYVGQYCETYMGYFNNSYNGPKYPHRCPNEDKCISEGAGKNPAAICPPGYTGTDCSIDVDECKELKPCAQICHNVPGSYNCDCREDFILEGDGQTCTKEIEEEGTVSTEVRDLLYQGFDKRIKTLEMVVSDKSKNFDSGTKKDLKSIHDNLSAMADDVQLIYSKINTLDNYAHEIDKKLEKISGIKSKETKEWDEPIKSKQSVKPTETSPSVKTMQSKHNDEVKSVKTPSVHPPSLHTPSVHPSSVHTPSVKTPSVKTPSVKTATISSPSVKPSVKSKADVRASRISGKKDSDRTTRSRYSENDISRIVNSPIDLTKSYLSDRSTTDISDFESMSTDPSTVKHDVLQLSSKAGSSRKTMSSRNDKPPPVEVNVQETVIDPNYKPHFQVDIDDSTTKVYENGLLLLHIHKTYDSKGMRSGRTSERTSTRATAGTTSATSGITSGSTSRQTSRTPSRKTSRSPSGRTSEAANDRFSGRIPARAPGVHSDGTPTSISRKKCLPNAMCRGKCSLRKRCDG